MSSKEENLDVSAFNRKVKKFEKAVCPDCENETFRYLGPIDSDNQTLNTKKGYPYILQCVNCYMGFVMGKEEA